jgi:hypothetical protein
MNDSKGKNISLYFGEDDLTLLDRFDKYCKSRHRSRTGGIYDLLLHYDYYESWKEKILNEYAINSGGER